MDLDPDYLKERFSEISTNPAYESVLIKQNATIHDIAWVEAHSLEFPLLHIEQRPQRHYPESGLLAHVLGYVGDHDRTTAIASAQKVIVKWLQALLFRSCPQA